MATQPLDIILPSTYGNRQTVIELKLRMELLGIPLDPYLIVVTDCWDGTPKGFKFVCLTQKLTNELCNKLDHAAPGIAKDAHLSQMSQGGTSWREISGWDSLHIIWLQGKPNDKYSNPAVNSYFNIHLDTVSICREIDSSGRCELDYPQVPKHIWRDLWHKK